MVLTFLPFNKKIEAQEGINLEAAAAMAGIDTGGICSGKKTCGKCKVLVTKGNDRQFASEEFERLTEEERERGIRLACCVLPREDTCVIIINENQGNQTYSGMGQFWNSTPPTEEAAQKEASARKETSAQKRTSAPGAYGIAMDLGTTTLEAVLYDKSTGREVEAKGILNPQRLHGGDVVSRITYALEKEGNAVLLHGILINACNRLIAEMTEGADIPASYVEKIVLAGNTTMTNLFLKRSLEGLSKAPFRSESYEGVLLKAKEAGLHVKSEGEAYVLPGIGGHVGGDTLGCIIGTGLYREQKKILLMDIGTNGELVLCHGGRLTAVSAAAGPAFEGGNISCGMRADTGAITAADFQGDKLLVHYIGEEREEIRPLGICGSGLIDCLYELYAQDKMDETGRLLGQAGEENRFSLWKDREKELFLTQKDIREFQLAKGAIGAGVTILLKEASLSEKDLDGIYLAGNFGGKLSIPKAIGVGLLPCINADKVEYIGNGALAGAKKILLGDVTEREAEAISRSVGHFELAVNPSFQDEFLKALSFPPKGRTL